MNRIWHLLSKVGIIPQNRWINTFGKLRIIRHLHEAEVKFL